MKDPTGLGKARPTGATPDDLSHPHATIGIINRPEPGSHALHQAACKIEASSERRKQLYLVKDNNASSSEFICNCGQNVGTAVVTHNLLVHRGGCNQRFVQT